MKIIKNITLLISSLCLISACDYFDKDKSPLFKGNTTIKNDAYHFEMTEEDKAIYHNYLSNLNSEDRKERENFYCGTLANKIVKFPKEFMFTPMGYPDISFLEQDGWKAKMRWCDDPIISYSVVVDWPGLEPARSKYGFDKLDWGTYDQYLVISQNEKDKDYSNAVIYVFGQLDQFGDEIIRNNPKNLRPYLENLFKKYKVTSDNKAIVRKDLNLEQLDIPVSKDKIFAVYWHRTRKNQADLVIECKPVPDKLFSWCTSYFFPKNIPNVISSFVVTEDNLANWPELIKKSEELFNSFLVKNESKKKK
ncbi:hypothetical protein GKC56_00555 [Neisseriaceae bacterium PsAf]|nr:hypothetical protein [Neisseriaceae bacterium PsAf]